MALMLHATCYNATVAPFIGGNNTHYGWTTCMHSQRQRAEGEYVCRPKTTTKAQKNKYYFCYGLRNQKINTIFAARFFID